MKGCGSFILIATFLFYIAGYISVLRTPVMVWHTAYWSKRLKIVTPFLFAQSSRFESKIAFESNWTPKESESNREIHTPTFHYDQTDLIRTLGWLKNMTCFRAASETTLV